MSDKRTKRDKRKKQSSAAQLVSDAILDWQKMAGHCDQVKHVNALLTARLVLRHNVPADECVTHAESLFAIVHQLPPEIQDSAARWELRLAFKRRWIADGTCRWLTADWAEIDQITDTALNLLRLSGPTTARIGDNDYADRDGNPTHYRCQFCMGHFPVAEWIATKDHCPKCGRIYDALLAQDEDDG